MKKKVHIVSHSHWDREWYMPYEQHHMRLIELMDDVLELFEKDPDFHSFHLDGQTILIDDYLGVRPEKREAIQKAIQEGKLRIGPFYILQDAFLTSAESNARNTLIGMQESKKWGQPVMLGYFPDTFGNAGQTPQMMLQSNLTSAAFGRGVKPIGFDNEVLADDMYTSQFSEMMWEGPDGSKIFGLLFANWYSNGNEIPTEKEAAKAFWNQKLADVEKFGSTDHYLLMNGVDHQPVQKDVIAAIRLANELYPDYEFIHSGFTEYLEAVQADLPEDIGTVKGELTSQETDGWFTLANTASARVYLKQWNTRVSHMLENIAEPLATMAQELTGAYPHDQLDYAWKTLMQNHPHDSICGCSVDEVHREMIPRFEKAYEVGQYVVDESLMALAKGVDTTSFPEESKPFIVFNTTGTKKSGVVTLAIELERKTFHEGVPERLYQELENRPAQSYVVINANGENVQAEVSEEKVRFNYDLPKDRFRIPYMQRYVTVSLEVEDMATFSWESYAVVVGEADQQQQSLVQENGRVLENDQVKVTIDENGTLSITSKKIDKTVSNLLLFEDIGDIANEYIFKQPEGDQPIYSTDFEHQVEVIEDSTLTAKVKLTHFMEIPKSADELLAKEQQAVIDFRNRKAQRSNEKIPFTVETVITLDRVNPTVQFETTVNNQAEDHRLRVLFPTAIQSDTHEAESLFEVVTRPNKVSTHWQNPTNAQHQHSFVNLHDDTSGITVSNYGLNEYEIVSDTIAVTLLRSVGELGDWGYFPTPEAQCKGEHTFQYAIELHGEPKTRYETYLHTQAWKVPFQTVQTNRHDGPLKSNGQFVAVEADTFSVTALKRRRADDALVLRGYNLSDEIRSIQVQKDGKTNWNLLNLLEEEVDRTVSETLKPYEIRTIGLEGGE